MSVPVDTHVPAGVMHVEYAAMEALRAFKDAAMTVDPRRAEELRKEAVISLAHALHVALTKRERVDPWMSARLFRELTNAAEVWR